MEVQAFRNKDADTVKAAVIAASIQLTVSRAQPVNEESVNEKRKFPRIKFVHPVIVKIGSVRIDAMAYNISQGGMCFISQKALSKGKSCIVRNDDFAIFKDGTIVSAGVPDSTGMVRYGVQFSPEYSLPEFSELIKKISDDNRKLHIHT